MKSRFTHLAMIGAFAVAFALAGCGRKGPLDPPPSGNAPAATAKPAKPAGASLNPLQSGGERTASPGFDADGKPLASSNAPKKHLPMDWLID